MVIRGGSPDWMRTSCDREACSWLLSSKGVSPVLLIPRPILICYAERASGWNTATSILGNRRLANLVFSITNPHLVLFFFSGFSRLFIKQGWIIASRGIFQNSETVIWVLRAGASSFRAVFWLVCLFVFFFFSNVSALLQKISEGGVILAVGKMGL